MPALRRNRSGPLLAMTGGVCMLLLCIALCSGLGKTVPVEPSLFQVGRLAVAATGAKKGVILASSKDEYDKLIGSALAQDEYGLAEQAVAGSVFSIAELTPVKLLESETIRGRVCWRVRVIEGEEKGRAGWVVEGQLKPAVKK